VIVSSVTTLLFWVITQQVVEITTTCCKIAQKSRVLSYFTAES